MEAEIPVAPVQRPFGSIFLAAADAGGVGQPVADRSVLSGDRDLDVDAGQAGEDGGGKFGGKLEQLETACQLFFPATAALRTVANAVHAISGTASAAAV